MKAEKSPLPNIRDVARKAGVSVATISRVINQTGPVAEETIKKVLDTIQELGYVPSAAARSLSTRATNVIGLLVTDIRGDNFFPPMLNGISTAASDLGYDLLVFTAVSKEKMVAPHIPIGEHNTDGMIVFYNSIMEEDLIRFNRRGFPIVLLHCCPPNKLTIPQIRFDNKSGAKEIVDHLIEVHNLRRIAYLAGPAGNQDSDERLAGYQQSLESHGIKFDPALIGAGDFFGPTARNTVGKWLKGNLQFDAIFAGDDDSAFGAIAALNSNGLKVPEDVAVVGFDDVPTSRYLTPSLTSVRAPIEEAGAQAAKKLISLINGKKVQMSKSLPVEVIIRHSCGCPKKDWYE